MGSFRMGLPAGALWLAVMSLAGAGCDLRQLAHDDLFGPGVDAGAGLDGGGRADAGTDGDADAHADADADAGADVGADVGGDTDADAAGDAAGEGGTDLGTGTGMLSGVVSSACPSAQGLDAKVGIAGRHQCSFPDKGSFFFSSLPLGTLELAVAKDGYLLYQATVVIAPGGTVHNVALVPASAGGCADPPPAQVACTCTDADCVRP
jgi:hypothetical protein